MAPKTTLSTLVLAIQLGSGSLVHAAMDGSWVPIGLAPGALTVYDSAADRLLVLGGTSSAVWQLSLANPNAWSLLAATGAPSSVSGSARAVYDPVRNRVLVFGAGNGGELWSLALSGSPAWTQLFPAGTPPTSRTNASCIYDPVRDRLLLYGGQYSPGGPPPPVRNDVWEVTLSGPLTWNPLATAGTTPPGRGLHGAVYDPIRDRMIVYAGATSGNFWSNDMWGLSLSGTPTWSEIVPAGPVPPARNSPVLIYDSQNDRLVMTNGNTSSSVDSRVWSLPLSGTVSWSEVATTATPVATSQGIYDPVRKRLVIHGSETWALTLTGSPVWSKIPAAEGSPYSFEYEHASYDPARDQMIVHGLNSFFGAGAETWSFSLGPTPSWTFLGKIINSTTVPMGEQAQIHDPVRDRTLVFGGALYPSGRSNAVWALQGGTSTWVQVATTGTPPPPRTGATAIYDPFRDRMIVFGGFNPDYVHPYLDEVWSLSLSGTPAWTMLTPGAGPSGRRDCAAIFDPARERMMIFGGAAAAGAQNDVWVLSLTGTPTWTPLSPSGTPPVARKLAAGIYEPGADALTIFGGTSGNGSFSYHDVWRLSLGTLAWAQLSPAGASPPNAGQPAAVYDPNDGRMAIYARDFGGAVWTIDWSGLTGVPPSVASGLRLSLAGSNPVRAASAAVSFTLTSADRARIQMFDVQGRTVWSREVGSLGPGRHELRLSGLAGLRPGVFLLRLEQDGRAARARAVILR